jgi:hypothetical protein
MKSRKSYACCCWPLPAPGPAAPSEDGGEHVSAAEAQILEEVAHAEAPEDVLLGISLLEAAHAVGVVLVRFSLSERTA